MKQLKCTQCGATINPDTLTCEYCGSVFFSSEIVKENEKKKQAEQIVENDNQSTKPFIDSFPGDNIRVRNLTDDEVYNVIKNLTTNHPAQFVFPIVFMICWTFIALYGVISILETLEGSTVGMFPAFVPMFFVVIGILTIINLIKQAFAVNLSYELRLIKEAQFNGAMLSLEKRETKKHNVKYVAALIILNYFRLNNFDGARELIIKLPQKELSELIGRSSIILEVAKELGVRTPDFVETVVNSLRARFESYYNNKQN